MMKENRNLTKAELKSIAVAALKSQYGFAPPKGKVVLLEANGDGTYILFEVSKHEYAFNSRRFLDGSVWVGSGTIVKNS